MKNPLTNGLAAGLAAVVLTTAGCTPAVTTTPSSTTPTVTVFAAASLKGTFTALGKTFEAAHPGITVRFSFAGSQALAEQITQGAPADVFASANEANLATLTNAGLATGTPRLFATNTLMIAVPPGNPAHIATFADLAGKNVKLVVCAPVVPCGTATQKLEQITGVTLTPVSEEQAVTDVLTKVEAGEADAGLVYRTDVLAAKQAVSGIAFPESSQAVNRNAIVALRAGAQPALGQQFVDLVLSAEGRTVLHDAGFGSVS